MAWMKAQLRRWSNPKRDFYSASAKWLGFCGQNWTGFDVSIPRHNPSPEVSALDGKRGEFRVVREAEILAVIETGAGGGVMAALIEKGQVIAVYSENWQGPRTRGMRGPYQFRCNAHSPGPEVLTLGHDGSNPCSVCGSTPTEYYNVRKFGDTQERAE